MAFTIDKQTLDDLNIFGKRGRDSIYSLFNTTRTRGGAQILEEMFRYPLSDEQKINKRSSIIRYFAEKKMDFPFRGELFDTIEYYLSNTDSRTKLMAEDNTLQRKLKGAMGADTDYEQLHKGVLASIEIVNSLQDFVQEMATETDAGSYKEEVEEMSRLVGDPAFAPLFAEKGAKKLPYARTADLDALLRFSVREKLQRLLYWIYNLDVYIAVAQVALRRGFVFATAHPGGSNQMEIVEMFHPQVKNAVSNNLSVDRNGNVLFLTGANMAGKSTFMKTLGITVFLAHMGFPVPAEKMEFAALEGMYTTINLPDNLAVGYSHFYAEVMRVKKVAQELSRAKNLLVIFDELFRGTNVKDAYDATIAITEGFARKRDCLFVISTHIIEAGDVLRERCENIRFIYLPTIMRGSVAEYPYKLAEGITSDRHGMMIVQNENILDILHESAGKTPAGAPFVVDKQTLEDLNLLGEFKPNSIFNVFNRTRTRGGKQLLESMFQQPLSEADAINARVSVMRYFQERALAFPVDDELFQTVDHYFSNVGGGNIVSAYAMTAKRKLMNYIGADKEYGIIRDGLVGAVSFLRRISRFADELAGGVVPDAYAGKLQSLRDFLADSRLAWVYKCDGQKPFAWYEVARYDFQLRSAMREEVRRLMQMFYEFDAYMAVTRVAAERNFTYARAFAPGAGENRIDVTEVYHPCIERAVANTIRLNQDKNVLFLTGANMAGKSTLMKSFSISLYLAHMGFPVAAEAMEFTVQDGMYTSINVSDNLVLGYSHFYAEVMRVKHVAEEVASGKRLLVVFDELFKGTNVKDAYDATVAVTDAFSGHRTCSYIISTHIIEAGHTLRERMDNLKFVYVPTVMKEGRPTYPYVLKEGITDDRHGMIIINNERIVEILNQ